MTTEPAPRHLLTWPDQGVEMAFRLIPAGSFKMGSRGYYGDEEPAHRVHIPEPFWMGETPVTQAQFALWTRAEKIEHENHFKGRPDHPAESLDWRQAQAYCAWLTRIQGNEFPDGCTLACLPTEAEWECACRAGSETEYETGDGEAALAEAGWFEGNSDNQTHPVGLKNPNGHGLYDMHGNVWEWCHDVWVPSVYRQRIDGSSDPGMRKRLDDWREGLEIMVASDQTRVLRGGSWGVTAYGCRSAFRYWDRPDDRDWDDGFRVCLVRGPARGQGGAERSSQQPGRRSRRRETQAEGRGRSRTEQALPTESIPIIRSPNHPAQRVV